jgi:hypothetical protein
MGDYTIQALLLLVDGPRIDGVQMLIWLSCCQVVHCGIVVGDGIVLTKPIGY